MTTQETTAPAAAGAMQKPAPDAAIVSAPNRALIVPSPARAHDWEMRLHAFIESEKHKPFAWGTHDCCIFAANWILALTGVDIAEDFRGKYTDEASCNALLAKLGYADVAAMIAAQLTVKWQFPAVQPNFAHRGDLIQVQQPTGPALCVVGLNGKHAHGVSDKGLVRMRTYHDAVKAWRVPYFGGLHG
jgi:hypothetical protein